MRHTGGRHRGPVRGRYPPRRSPAHSGDPSGTGWRGSAADHHRATPAPALAGPADLLHRRGRADLPGGRALASLRDPATHEYRQPLRPAQCGAGRAWRVRQLRLGGCTGHRRRPAGPARAAVASRSLPVYLIYPHARSYPAKLRLFAEIIRTDMPNLVGMTHTGTNAPQPAAIAGRPVPEYLSPALPGWPERVESRAPKSGDRTLVIHYSASNGNVACGRTGSSLNSSADATQVSCKLCLRSVEKAVSEPVRKTPSPRGTAGCRKGGENCGGCARGGRDDCNHCSRCGGEAGEHANTRSGDQGRSDCARRGSEAGCRSVRACRMAQAPRAAAGTQSPATWRRATGLHLECQASRRSALHDAQVRPGFDQRFAARRSR